MPVMVFLAGMISISACSTAEETAETDVIIMQEPVTVHSSEVTGFTFEASPPDTVALKWQGEGSAVITDIRISSGEKIEVGDTLFHLSEDLQVVEIQRLSMELDIASAMLNSDSLFKSEVDSLTTLLDSLINDESIYLSPLDGTLEYLLVETDEQIRSGHAIAAVSVASSELFRVYCPSDCIISSWPDGDGSGIRLIEEVSGYAVYSGELGALEARFSELLAVPRGAVFETDLESYVITVENDTIPVRRTGELNSLVIIIPGEPVLSDLMTWTEK